MTEEGWIDSTDPKAMLAHLRAAGTESDRKLRLFVCACWRPRVEVVVQPHALLRDIEIVEAGEYSWTTPMNFYPTYRDPWEAARRSSEVGIRAAKGRPVEPGLGASQQATLLRCIFGNPFRPLPPLSPSILAWENGLVIRLAEAAFEQRLLPSGHLEPARLLVLADAIEEAGCTNPELPGHLRGPGPHVRGCFVIDLLTGRAGAA